MLRKSWACISAGGRSGPDPLCAGPGDEGAASRPDGARAATTRTQELGGCGRSGRAGRQGGDRPLGTGRGGNEVLRPRRRRRGLREQLGGRATVLLRYRHPHRVDSQSARVQQRGPRGPPTAGLAPLTNAYLDARLADTIVIVGANPYETQTNYFLDHMAPNLQGATLGKQAGRLRRRTRRAGTHDRRRPAPDHDGGDCGGRGRRGPGDASRHRARDRHRPAQRNRARDTRPALHDVGFVRRHCEWQTFESWQRSTLQVDRPAREFVSRAARAVRNLARTHPPGGAMDRGPRRRRALPPAYPAALRERADLGVEELREHCRNRGARSPRRQRGQAGTGISRLGGHQEAYVRPPYPGSRPAINVDEKVRRGEAKVFWVGGLQSGADPPCGPRRWSRR